MICKAAWLLASICQSVSELTSYQKTAGWPNQSNASSSFASRLRRVLPEKIQLAVLFFPCSGLSVTSRLITDWPVIMNQVGQCQAGSVSLSPHISISEISPCVSEELQKKEQTRASLLKLTSGPGEKKRQCLEQHGFIFSCSGALLPQRDTKTDLHATRCSLLPAANLLLWRVSFPTAAWRTFQT